MAQDMKALPSFNKGTVVPEELTDKFHKRGWRVYTVSPYALSSLSFAAFGLYYWLYFGGLGGIWEASLWFIQTVVCYGNDVWSFGLTSWWKPVDRVYASSMIIYYTFRYAIENGFFSSPPPLQCLHPL